MQIATSQTKETDNLRNHIVVKGAYEHNLKGIDVAIERGKITIITGVSGSGKSSLAFDTVLSEAQRRFFYTLSNYSRQFLDLGTRAAVKHVGHLSPAIALAQNETLPSRRATVGTLTDVSELWAVAMARFGTRYCPKHNQPTEARSFDKFFETLMKDYGDKNIAICMPLAEKKKGNFATKLAQLAKKGFSRAWIDGELYEIADAPDLAREEKHTIKIIVDLVKVADRNRDRIERSFTQASTEGYAEYVHAKSAKDFDFDNKRVYSTKGGCPTCGFSWSEMDSRYFSANSLGKCNECDGYGAVSTVDDGEYVYEYSYNDVEDTGQLDSADLTCDNCEGTGLNPDLKSVRIENFSVYDIQKQTVGDNLICIDRILKIATLSENPAAKRVLSEIKAKISKLSEVRLDYLTVNRRVRSLSVGELQRLKLAGILSESLHGVLYVLDEPSQGLHPTEVESLCDTLSQLKSLGNTLLIVDHDETLMRRADWIIDLGPGGGAEGGNLMAQFKPQNAADFVHQSVTAKHLSQPTSAKTIRKINREFAGYIDVRTPSLNNLKGIDNARFAKGALNVVCGVSGAGKSSLTRGVLYENIKGYLETKSRDKFKFRYCKGIDGLDGFETIALVDRKPVAKSSVSMPATYLGVFTLLREIYEKLPDAQIAGLGAADFSLARAGGRCETCGGRGEMNLKMRFLADARVRCDNCHGKRYNRHILQVKFNQLSLSDVLNLTIEQGYKEFSTFRKIEKLLQPAIKLGLGYLKLGQPSASLSGGEAQRLKIVPYLVKRYNESSIIVMDEPTTGLHFEDVQKLLFCLDELISTGATVILIENNPEIIANADWLVRVGPGSAANGGRIESGLV